MGSHRSTLLAFLLLTLLVALCVCVDRNNFKTCEQENKQRYEVQKLTLDGPSHISATLLNSRNTEQLTLDFYFYQNDIVRMQINEKNEASRAKRYQVKDVLMPLHEAPFGAWTPTTQGQEILLTDNKKMRVYTSPFKLELLMNDQVVLSVNDRELLNFEVLRAKKEQSSEGNEEKEENEEEKDSDNLWQETFKSHHDSKPNGPTAVSLDITFHDTQHVYGIPEHAANFSLQDTKSTYTDPYRLYNLDVFEYELNNPMSLYGSVPLMVSHDEKKSLGVFWLNAAETWIDVVHSNSMLAPLFGGTPRVETHWISESGIIDVFFLLTSSPRQLFTSYAALTSPPYFPPLFAIGYHQCKWNYKDEADVKDVNQNFDVYSIPYDVIWLDIEHTDGKKYFTWDPTNFPHPEQMQLNLAQSGRKLVTIIDPHIKRDKDYYIHQEASSKGYYIKNKNGNDFDGFCWPGSSGYPDFTSPEVRNWWRTKFAYTEYKGSTNILHVWNDMNEPSVFNGPEVSMHKDNIHLEGWEHRDVHNVYGYYYQMATYEGLRYRNSSARPFVLSRAFYAGTQRYGAIWTGDNRADWNHLAMAQPMLLSLAVTGITFAGADVGGFFGNPSAELITRWYQAGAFYPFFRAHAHLDSKRREPWLFGEPYTSAIRSAIRTRYTLLPYLYTLFAEAHKTGMPVLRPLWAEFPTDKSTFNEEKQFLLGSSLLVAPVTAEGQESIDVYLPGEAWYSYWDPASGTQNGKVKIATPIDRIPVFVRSGSIIPRKDRPRRASFSMTTDPYTLVVYLDSKGSASGALWIDDGESMAYTSGLFLQLDLRFANHQLASAIVAGDLRPTNAVERILVYGHTEVKRVTNINNGEEVAFVQHGSVLTLRKPNVHVNEQWTLRFE